jgi:alcohol dehydrogenase
MFSRLALERQAALRLTRLRSAAGDRFTQRRRPATGIPTGTRAAVEHTAPDGICTSVGALHRNASFPAGLMYGRNVTFKIARSHARALIPQVLELVRAGKLYPERVTTDLEKLDDAPRAIKRHVHGEATKTILVE